MMHHTKWLFLVLHVAIATLAQGDRIHISNVTKMPRADSFGYEHESRLVTSRGLKIEAICLSQYDEPGITPTQKTLARSLIADASAFFKVALQLRHPISAEGILLARSCEYSASTGTIFADDAPVRPACPDRCAPVTTCGIVRIPDKLLRHCTDMKYLSSILEIQDYVNDYMYVEPQPVDADFVLFVNIVRGPSCDAGISIAEAGVCQQDLTTYRPIAGFITFCPEVLNHGHDYRHLLQNVKHDILHLLGFSVHLYGMSPAFSGRNYDSYTDANQPRLPFEHLTLIGNWPVFIPPKYIQRVTDSKGVRRILLSTPKILEAARGYFRCSEITGIELENQADISIIYGSHWESRILPEEIMAVNVSASSKVSVFTLAFLEDTGWYRVNYSLAEPMTFGKNAGCQFVTEKSCTKLVEHYPEFFCQSETLCTADSRHKAFCNVESQALITNQQFESRSVHGIKGSTSSGFCPQALRKMSCQTDVERWGAQESFSPTSVCVESQAASKDCQLNSQSEARCHIATCYSTRYFLHDLMIYCTYEGEVIHVLSRNQSSDCDDVLVTCPPCAHVCADCSRFPKNRTTTRPVTTTTTTTSATSSNTDSLSGVTGRTESVGMASKIGGDETTSGIVSTEEHESTEAEASTSTSWAPLVAKPIPVIVLRHSTSGLTLPNRLLVMAAWSVAIITHV